MPDRLTSFPGLVWAYHFDAETGKATELKEESTLPQALPDGGFCWLHLSLPDVRVEQFVACLPSITPATIATVTTRDRHMFLTVVDNALTGVMPDVQSELGDELTDVDRFRFILTDRLLVTARTRPLRSMQTVGRAIAAGHGFKSSTELFGALTEAFEITIEAVIDRLSDEIDEIEEEVFKGRTGTHRSRLGSLRRDIANVHRTLRTTFRLYFRLENHNSEALPANFKPVLERRSHHIAAIDQDVILLQDRARLLHEEINTRQQDQTNHHLFILSLATVVIMPPTLITGMFGMNTKDMFLQDVPNGTLYAMMLAVGAALAAWYALRRYGIGR